MKKQIAISLACIFCFTSFTACAGTGGKSNSTSAQTTTQAVSDTSKLDSLSKRKLVSDDLPDKDYGGIDFIVTTYDQLAEYNVVEEATGDVIDDAIYERNRTVEERFNIKIKLAGVGVYTDTSSFIQKAVLAGEHAFDLASHHVVSMGGLALQGLFMNWYDIPNINFSKPWWSSCNTNELTYDGVAFLTVGDFALTSLSRTYCMFFDKNKAESYNLGNIYDIVRSGDWTVDKLSELTRDIKEDLNNDGKMDYNDFYGFATDSRSNINAYLWAFENPVMKKNSAGVPELVVKTAKINSIIDKLNTLMNINEGTYYDYNFTNYPGETASPHRIGVYMFRDGKALFANGYFEHAILYFRDFEDEYGIIPYPKYDDKQENYATMVDGGHAALAVPKTVLDPEMVGIITEALCAESYKTVVPAYYDVALKVKYARDAESVEMLDMIMNTRKFDFGYVYDNWKGVSFFLEQLVGTGNTNFESYYASKESSVLQYYNSVLEAFEKAAT